MGSSYDQTVQKLRTTELSMLAGPFLCHGFGTKQQNSMSGTAASEESPHPGTACSGMPLCTFTINLQPLLVQMSLS